MHTIIPKLFSRHWEKSEYMILRADIQVLDHNMMIFDLLFIPIMERFKVVIICPDERTKHYFLLLNLNKFAILLQAVRTRRLFSSLMIFLLNLIRSILRHSHRFMSHISPSLRHNMNFLFLKNYFMMGILFIWMYNNSSSIVFLKSYFSFSLSRIQSL